MGVLLGCEGLHLEYPAKVLFKSVTLGINEGDRIGIVGRNGDGKSSLLSLLAGSGQPDAGQVTHRNSLRVGVLAQNDALDDDATVAFSVVGDSPEYVWASDPRIRSVIDGLIADIPWDALVGTLSGGQRRRVDLARVLIGDWDVLMLDEPTNHLDMRGISWLAVHLKNRWQSNSGALLVVTHDRWFLDEVALSMWEVHDGVVEPFEGGYSAYIMQRVERQNQEDSAERKRQNAMRRELAFLSRGARARSSKPRFHVEAARALIAEDPPEVDPLELKRTAMSRLGKQVVDFMGVCESLGGKTILDHVDWAIGPGDRFGLLGENGAGKTTLLRLAQGALAPTAGRVRIGKTVRFAVLSQNLDELLRFGDDRVRQVLARYNTRYEIEGKEVTPAQLLERLGFDSREMSTPVCDLSGGQKRRLQLMLILLDKPNVLILDEPGNDLDTNMLAVMESLLDTWPGTLLLVSHDRYLMERVTTDQYALIDGCVRHVPGGVDEYLKLLEGKAATGGTGKGGVEAAKSTNAKTASFSDSGLSQNEIRALKKEISSTERKMSTLRGKIEDSEESLLSVDPTDYVELGRIQQQTDSLKAQLATLEDQWLELGERLGA